MTGGTARPRRGPGKMRSSQKRYGRSMTGAEGPTATRGYMPSLELWECAAPASGLPG